MVKLTPGGDFPGPALSRKENPLSDGHIPGIADMGVAPQVAESPTWDGAYLRVVEVAPQVAESPHEWMALHFLSTVAPQVAESPTAEAGGRAF